MPLPTFMRKLKKTLMEYLPSPTWPWEIISGLFIVIIMIDSLKYFSKDISSINRPFFALEIIIVDLIWGIFDGWMLIFTNLLREGRYNKMISRIKSWDKKLATEIITNELRDTLISLCDEKTKEQIIDMVLRSLSSINQDDLKKPKISKDDIIAAFVSTFFVFLPCIFILPFFLLINNLDTAISVSNMVALALLFGFGYKLASCTNRNKTLTGLIIMIIGLLIIMLAIVFSA